MTEYKKAILAGGCFWGMQDLIRKQPGVVDTRVGYTGGRNDHATYRNHPGHAEAIEIAYDPAQTDFRNLLEFFFQIHDPTTKDRQGNDAGSSYRSAIFYVDASYLPANFTVSTMSAQLVLLIAPFDSKFFSRALNTSWRMMNSSCTNMSKCCSHR